MRAALAVAVGGLACGAANAQILLATPPPANNGGSSGWAIFFDLTAGANPLTITAMRSANTGAAGVAFTVEVFTRSGTALAGVPAPVGSGPGSSSAGWTSRGTAPGVQGTAGSTGVSEVIDTPNFDINAGETVGVAVLFTGVGPRYFGTGTPPHSVFSDANLMLTTGEARSAPFTTGGTAFASRALVGEIHYTVIPAPGALALLGLGGVVAARRRR